VGGLLRGVDGGVEMLELRGEAHPYFERIRHAMDVIKQSGLSWLTLYLERTALGLLPNGDASRNRCGVKGGEMASAEKRPPSSVVRTERPPAAIVHDHREREQNVTGRASRSHSIL